jgi:hypothetical protein
MIAAIRLAGLSASLVAATAVAQPPAPQPPINVPPAPGLPPQQIVVQPSQVVAPPPPAIQGPPIVVPGVPILPAPTALTLAQAERSLRGLPPGCHHVMFIHPVTCCPVAVTLRISGCLTDVRAGKFLGTHRLVFKVKGHGNDVVVKFKPNGSVVVAD